MYFCIYKFSRMQQFVPLSIKREYIEFEKGYQEALANDLF